VLAHELLHELVHAGVCM